jgi:hypothetical protein
MAADEFTWVMSELVTRFREHTGMPNTSDMSDADVHKWINDYYRHIFPLTFDLDLLNAFFTQATAVSDSGEYSLGQTVLKIERPVTVNGSKIRLYHDKSFFADYPEDEQYITVPTLAIGTDSTKVKNSAFTYDISGNSYYKASAETAFSGLSTVPQNKYGAFSLKINAAGTITIAEASDNSTGYATPGLAVAGLAVADSDSCYMGFVTVISTAATGFIPGTTALDNGSVTDTYTDGKHQNRGDPQAAFVYDEKLYVRPKADRVMQIKAPHVVRPDAIDTGAPLDVAWGPLIALGAAILQTVEENKDSQRGQELARIFKTRADSIDAKQRKQRQPQYAQPSF